MIIVHMCQQEILNLLSQLTENGNKDKSVALRPRPKPNWHSFVGLHIGEKEERCAVTEQWFFKLDKWFDLASAGENRTD